MAATPPSASTAATGVRSVSAGRGGNLRFAVRGRDGRSWWLHDARSITARYRPGELDYRIADPRLEGEIALTVVALAAMEASRYARAGAVVRRRSSGRSAGSTGGAAARRRLSARTGARCRSRFSRALAERNAVSVAGRGASSRSRDAPARSPALVRTAMPGVADAAGWN